MQFSTQVTISDQVLVQNKLRVRTVSFSELKAFSWSHIKPMTTNGLQTNHSEKLSIFPHTKLSSQNLLSPSDVLFFSMLQGEVK